MQQRTESDAGPTLGTSVVLSVKTFLWTDAQLELSDFCNLEHQGPDWQNILGFILKCEKMFIICQGDMT